MSENRLDDMSEEVIRRRLQTYHDEGFETLSFYPPELVHEIDAGRPPIDVPETSPSASPRSRAVGVKLP